MKEYARKDFTAITVKALCASTPVARTTFYSYFNNTDDVRCEIEDELIRGLLAVSEKVSGGDMAGIRAMERGKVLLYQGAFTKLAGLGARIAPRSVTRKFARKMNH